jgi:oligopeptide/dipeptide ABC transporter ATP-binding protein
VMIAMALAGRPALLIADEPTTALDVTTQAEILDLLVKLQADTGMGMLLITHDFGVVARVAQEVCVMYAGRIIERGSTGAVLDEPAHPYTQALLSCLPERTPIGRLPQTIPGSVPALGAYPMGCRFHPRCSLSRRKAVESVRDRWALEDGAGEVLRRCVRGTEGEVGGQPEIREMRTGHEVACWEV